MKTLQERIKDFVKNPDHAVEALTLLQVGLNKGDPLPEVMNRVLAYTLLRFHKIPITVTGEN